jgi:hypothetical protein
MIWMSPWGRPGHMQRKMTAIYVIVKQMTRKVEGYGNKPYINNFFSSPDFFNSNGLK